MLFTVTAGIRLSFFYTLLILYVQGILDGIKIVQGRQLTERENSVCDIYNGKLLYDLNFA